MLRTGASSEWQQPDRNVLRMGAFELLYSDTPDRVAINEAVELSRRFGSAQSSQFVNGLLDRLLKDKDRGLLQ